MDPSPISDPKRLNAVSQDHVQSDVSCHAMKLEENTFTGSNVFPNWELEF